MKSITGLFFRDLFVLSIPLPDAVFYPLLILLAGLFAYILIRTVRRGDSDVLYSGLKFLGNCTLIISGCAALGLILLLMR